ncbi:MAG: hypothetical protein IJE24_04045 [Oscillospiraceae bacterium]|nr:hypothetical protein [Oscillospiraceae bacterium]
MKKMITILLVLVLTLGLFAGCRGGATMDDMATDASEAMNDLMPKDDNGQATDGDGFIGGGNHPKSGNGAGTMMPNDF